MRTANECRTGKHKIARVFHTENIKRQSAGMGMNNGNVVKCISAGAGKDKYAAVNHPQHPVPFNYGMLFYDVAAVATMAGLILIRKIGLKITDACGPIGNQPAACTAVKCPQTIRAAALGADQQGTPAVVAK
jgi:hypothetical protein